MLPGEELRGFKHCAVIIDLGLILFSMEGFRSNGFNVRMLAHQLFSLNTGLKWYLSSRFLRSHLPGLLLIAAALDEVLGVKLFSLLIR